MEKNSYKKIFIVAIFAIAMAFLETVIVIYLRKMYYPSGFSFPLKGFIEPWILNLEWIREFATIVMLACIGMLAGRKFYEKFAYFLLSFAVWDIFYYVWLKVFLNWPASFKTWDLLFLIPIAWASPVLAPVIYSIVIAILAVLIIKFQDEKKKVIVNLREIILFILGSALILYTFLYDYGKLILSGNSSLISSYIPTSYNWPLFILGEFTIILAIFFFYNNNKKSASQK